MGLVGNNNEEKIWNFLFNKIGNAYGVAGLMGNLYAESGLRPNNLQDTYNTKFNMDDETYTNWTDNGKYSGFIHDLAGYGLAQWTFWSRKQRLYEYAKSQNASIGNLEMQLNFLVKELSENYSAVWTNLKTVKTVKDATDLVLDKYEALSTMGETIKIQRRSYAQTYYDRYSGEVKQKAIAENQKQIDLYKASEYAKYIVSTGGHVISNSGGDERGKISGGTAGDQTGNEWVLKYWYNRPWNCVLRYPNPKVALRIAELGCEAALNNKIGYDQGQRNTYWQQLQKAGYRPSKITTACEADCSAGVIANVKAVGYLLNISALKDIKATYTGDMRNSFVNAGFQLLTDSRYLTGTTYLLPGDILLNDAKHTATNISVGSNMINATIPVNTNPSTPTSSIWLQKGSTGEAVKTMQTMLIACGYNCGSTGADGDFGKNTQSALAKFQQEAGLVVDGVYGDKTKAALEAKYQQKQTEKAGGGSQTSFLVKVNVASLNIRKGPGTKYAIAGKIKDKGTYTIVKTQGNWGKLKSGAGWILLTKTKRI